MHQLKLRSFFFFFGDNGGGGNGIYTFNAQAHLYFHLIFAGHCVEGCMCMPTFKALDNLGDSRSADEGTEAPRNSVIGP